MKREALEILVPVELLKRLVPLVIEGNNYLLETGEETDTEAECELEELMERKLGKSWKRSGKVN